MSCLVGRSSSLETAPPLQSKNEVLAELMEAHLALKGLGETTTCGAEPVRLRPSSSFIGSIDPDALRISARRAVYSLRKTAALQFRLNQHTTRRAKHRPLLDSLGGQLRPQEDLFLRRNGSPWKSRLAQG